MAQTNATGSGPVNNVGGSFYSYGAINYESYSNVSTGESKTDSDSKLGAGTGVAGIAKTTPVTLTSVADNSGKCRFTLNGHGLQVGDVLEITGATAASLNTIHHIVAKTNNTFDTDIDYVVSATAGDYSKFIGVHNELFDGRYVSPLLNQGYIAGISNSGMNTAAFGLTGNGLNRKITAINYDITSYDYLTHAPITGVNYGQVYTYGKARADGDVDEGTLGVYNYNAHIMFDQQGTPVTKEYPSIIE